MRARTWHDVARDLSVSQADGPHVSLRDALRDQHCGRERSSVRGAHHREKTRAR